MNPNPQLRTFLGPYSQEIQQLTLALRNFVTELIPEANELIWDNYNAVAMAYSKSEKLKDAFCHISVYSKHVNFGFNRGAELIKGDLRLEGKGALIRHISVKDMSTFPKKKIAKMMIDAIQIADQRNPELSVAKSKSLSLVMSISEKKIRPKK